MVTEQQMADIAERELAEATEESLTILRASFSRKGGVARAFVVSLAVAQYLKECMAAVGIDSEPGEQAALMVRNRCAKQLVTEETERARSTSGPPPPSDGETGACKPCTCRARPE